MYKNTLKFKGTWRTYQERVLSRFVEYKKDGKVHIVAAPGSGKTTLGIELIRLLNEPCIVLAPSITIREQWVSRIEEEFLVEGIQIEDIVSQDLKDMKAITVTTYQAIHSAMTNYKGELFDESWEDTIESELCDKAGKNLKKVILYDKLGKEGNNEKLSNGVGEDTNETEICSEVDNDVNVREIVDYEAFNLIEAIRKHKVKTICLDECHHLRNEWWKALETFQKETSLDYTIALTATPPYDSMPELWTRYMKVCGEIDEEIIVPELVKDGNLCPHQDYVYFNYPTKEEMRKIKSFKRKRDEYCEQLLKDEEFKNIISTHTALKHGADYDKLLENPAYLSSILIYLNATGVKVSGNYKKLLGYTRLEKPSPKWFEILLQGVLYKDTESYDIDEDTIKKYRNELKVRSLLDRRKVTLELKQGLKKELITSLGKCESIKDITFNEYKSMGKELRLLILCDYIKKEYKPAVGNLDMNVHALGVMPYFELLRRENLEKNTDLKLGVLCGSIVIVPAGAKERLLELSKAPEKISFKGIGNLSEQEYVEVIVQGNRHFLTGVITQLFEEGYMEVLVGTKALLGEGWDSPCVNSLILASFVGSFMLSNQMRGRAIRAYKNNPNKTSNIWHLVCVVPKEMMGDSEQSNQLQKQVPEEDDNDIQMVERRMNNFLGLHYDIDSIESGIHRITAICNPINNKKNVKKTNAKMLQLAADRDKLKSRWDKSLLAFSEMEVADEVCKSKKLITSVIFFDYLGYMTVAMLSQAILHSLGRSMRYDDLNIMVYRILMAVMYLCIASCCTKIVQLLNPLKVLKKLGVGVRQALMDMNKFDDWNHRVQTEENNHHHVIHLVGGTGHDKALFAQCMSEMLDDVDNQRYILYAPRRRRKKDGYFPVPDVFCKRREDAELFASCMKKYIGNYKLVYTRNPEGRKILLKGRVYAMANQQNRAMQMKRVKGVLE